MEMSAAASTSLIAFSRAALSPVRPAIRASNCPAAFSVVRRSAAREASSLFIVCISCVATSSS